MKITDFAYVYYPVSDIPKARAFYETVLGLKATSTWGDDKQGWFEYEVGPHTLAISNFMDETKSTGSGPVLALEIEDYEDAIKDLKAKGVPFDKESSETPVCHFASILDPSGNRLFIHKRKPA